jgi:hypothetical protein
MGTRVLFLRTYPIGPACGELVHTARCWIRNAVGLLRGHMVVIRCPGLQILDAHPKYHHTVTWVESGRRVCRELKLIGIFLGVGSLEIAWPSRLAAEFCSLYPVARPSQKLPP